MQVGLPLSVLAYQLCAVIECPPRKQRTYRLDFGKPVDGWLLDCFRDYNTQFCLQRASISPGTGFELFYNIRIYVAHQYLRHRFLLIRLNRYACFRKERCRWINA